MTGWTLAVLPLLGVCIGAALQFLASKTLERSKHLTGQRASAYADYFQAVSDLAVTGRNEKAVTALANAKSRICLYGSPRVIACLGRLERHGASLSSPDARRAVLELVGEARRETAPSLRSVRTDDLRLVLFGPEEHDELPLWAEMDGLAYQAKIRSEWEDRFPTKK
ncbi:MAG: hypothetical protein ACK5WW_10665 [Brevundimonas sp.]|jgi:hypothetical protein|uniref:hypothetical protein n=1 Tax=Brevundimonas sp. TaxID=1871086 RepID=UPI00391C3FDF